jgi:putative ABC transport system substrate-binding protein
MDRRGFPAGIAGALPAVALTLMLVAVSHVAVGQEARRTFHVGFVGLDSPGLAAQGRQTYQQRLRDLGWVEGQNISMTYRWADGDFTSIPGLVRSIMKSSPDLLILPCGDPMNAARDPINAARALRPDIPIVARCMELAGFGREIATVTRPGGFTTGVTDFSPGATRRRLELLKELVPSLSGVGVLYLPRSSWAAHWTEVEAAARTTGVALERIEWDNADPGEAFHIAGQRRVGVLMTLSVGAGYINRDILFELAARHRTPVLYDFPMEPAGDEVGLMAYHADGLPSDGPEPRWPPMCRANRSHSAGGGSSPGSRELGTSASATVERGDHLRVSGEVVQRAGQRRIHHLAGDVLGVGIGLATVSGGVVPGEQRFAVAPVDHGERQYDLADILRMRAADDHVEPELFDLGSEHHILGVGKHRVTVTADLDRERVAHNVADGAARHDGPAVVRQRADTARVQSTIDDRADADALRRYRGQQRAVDAGLRVAHVEPLIARAPGARNQRQATQECHNRHRAAGVHRPALLA